MLNSLTPTDASFLRDNNPFEFSLPGINYILYIAHELKIFPLIGSKKAMSFEEISENLKINPRATQVILSICMSIGLLSRRDDQTYILTQFSECYFLSESPFYWGDYLDVVIQNPDISSYEAIKNGILTGKPQIYKGKDFFAENEQNEELARIFTRAMHVKSKIPALFWPSCLDLSQYKCFLDIGGGSGIHSINAVRTWPQLEAIVYELPLICKLAEEFIQEASLENKISAFGGDMWTQPFPSSADIHFYCDVLHDWPPDQGQFLVNKSYESLGLGGRIIIYELLMEDDKGGPLSAALYNLVMLLCTEGQQFTRQELFLMLEKAHFKDIQALPTGFGNWHLITGVK